MLVWDSDRAPDQRHDAADEDQNTKGLPLAKSSGLAVKINIVSLRSTSARQPISTHIRQPRSKNREPTDRHPAKTGVEER